jgi:uncharacterized protein YgiM (DUF1202 family)
MKKYKIKKLATFLTLMMILNTWACTPKKLLDVSQKSPHQGDDSSQAAEVDSQTVRSPLKGTAVVQSGALNLRAGPSTESPILGVLKKGSQVTILSSHRKWREVTTQERRIGWVFSAYLTDVKTSSGEEIRVNSATQKTGTQKGAPSSGAAPQPDRTPPTPEPPKTADAAKPDRENHPPSDASGNTDGQKNYGAVETVSSVSAAAAKTPRQERNVVFADPQGYFELRYPIDWRKTQGLQYEVEQLQLQSPSHKLELWILNTKNTDGYTLPQFYIDMVAPLKQLYGDDIEIRPLRGSETAGAGWLQGQVTLRSGDRATYDYVMTENAGQFWVIMEVRRPGAPQNETEALAAIKNTFSFSSKN